MRRHPELRWLVSVGVIVAVGAAVATSVSGVFRSDSVLPATSPEQLVAQVRAPHVTGYFGSIVTHVDLGLPTTMGSALTAALPVGGALLQGTHRMRYWYGGEDRQRVAVVGPTAEQDVFRNGTDLLLWDTATRLAQRSTLPDDDVGALPWTVATPAALTPPQLASRILEMADEASDTTLRSGDRVADRPTYELVLRPETSTSRIGAVHIQIDGRESVPLGVQIFARDADQPAVDVSFTSVSFADPARQNFSFTPPADADVRSSAMLGPLANALEDVSVVGSDWLRVACYRLPAGTSAVLDTMLGGSPQKVKGRWGKGRLLRSALLSVLVTDRGRVLVGAVAPAVLYRAARK